MVLNTFPEFNSRIFNFCIGILSFELIRDHSVLMTKSVSSSNFGIINGLLISVTHNTVCGLICTLSFAYLFLSFRPKHRQAQYAQKHKRCLYHSVILRYIERMCYVIANIVSFSSEHILKEFNIFFSELLVVR